MTASAFLPIRSFRQAPTPFQSSISKTSVSSRLISRRPRKSRTTTLSWTTRTLVFTPSSNFRSVVESRASNKPVRTMYWKMSLVSSINLQLDYLNTFVHKFKATQLTKDTKVSILSPRIFSILPEGNSASPRLLSPNMFSFQKDGIFSLPDMFQVVHKNDKSIDYRSYPPTNSTRK